ncbi:chromo-domain-containing protein [Peniophora sp. CONT]|nr:chromo-domain-containing protein [Peniophora sp. CONT]
MGRLRSSTSAQSKQSASRPPARSTSVASATKHTLAGTLAVFVDNDGDKHTYKLSKSADTFVYVVVERHKIFERRCAGDPAPWTTDRIFQECRFTNVYRILDRDTQYILYAVIAKGSADFRERVFRVLLFRLFDRIDTYEFLIEEFGVPSWKGFDRKAYTKALDGRKADGFSLAGHAYQMPAPTESKIGGSSYHDRLLRLLELMMLSGFTDVISECAELCDLQVAIALYPTMNAFLGYQVILDLNMIPQLMLPEDWALPGPGAQKGLHMIFGKQLKPTHISLALSWVHEHFDELVIGAGFSKKDIPSLKPGTPGLSIVDIEHVLCEYSKYVRIASPDKYNCRPFDLQEASSKVTRILPKNWKSARAAFLERNRKYTNPAADKKGEYEISAILDDAKIDGELHYKVRWQGWGPDADTWEPAATFKKQSPELVDAYVERRSKIEDLLKKYRSGRM